MQYYKFTEFRIFKINRIKNINPPTGVSVLKEKDMTTIIFLGGVIITTILSIHYHSLYKEQSSINEDLVKVNEDLAEVNKRLIKVNEDLVNELEGLSKDIEKKAIEYMIEGGLSDLKEAFIAGAKCKYKL